MASPTSTGAGVVRMMTSSTGEQGLAGSRPGEGGCSTDRVGLLALPGVCSSQSVPIPRISLTGMKISRPDIRIGRYRMIKHDRDKHNEPNPQR